MPALCGGGGKPFLRTVNPWVYLSRTSVCLDKQFKSNLAYNVITIETFLQQISTSLFLLAILKMHF